MRCLSTSRAAWRPSWIAHTTSDCPRRQSPAAKDAGLARHLGVAVGPDVAALVEPEPELLREAALRAEEAEREQIQTKFTANSTRTASA
jgi:hypothetical protein